jgi:pyruvate/2-oxoglutarate dehydrogenase complex dihydrolipoamide dehydrogenase (E3) component
LVAAERGHDVTLFEKSDSLGGLLKHADFVRFKWPLRDFKNYLLRQIKKSKVNVYLNTEATPQMIEREGYDAAIIAIGAEPAVPPIPGVDGKNVVYVNDVFGKEDTLAEEVVIVGGGIAGAETGLHLAQKGHKVTILEKQKELAPTMTRIHYFSMFMNAVKNQKNLKYILNACCKSIQNDGVIYIDGQGIEHKLEAGTIIIATGVKPKTEKILEYAKTGIIYRAVGDCALTRSNIQKAMRTAYAAASTL